MDNVSNNAWQRYRGDFNNMDDAQIEASVKEAQDKIDVEEEWIEAVASWKAAGKPRREKNND